MACQAAGTTRNWAGEVLGSAGPTRGRIWTKTIERDEVESHRERLEIISTRLFAGRTVIHVLSDIHPGDGFAPVEGGLEDVYFSTLAHSRRAA